MGKRSMSDNWKICWVTVIFAGIFSIPSWLSLFQIDSPEVPSIDTSMLPLPAFVVGFAIGWIARGVISRHSKQPAAEEAAASAEASAQSISIGSLVPREKELMLRLYDEVQVHVGMENLMAAQALHGRGIAFRTDAPESGVISQCYIELTDEWKRILSDEKTRKALQGRKKA